MLRARNGWVVAGFCGIVGVTAWLAARASRPALPVLWPVTSFQMTGVSTQGVRPMGLSDLKGRFWVVNFIYTRCSGPCPLLSEKMRQLQRRLPIDVGLLSFTVDPDHDTPDVLKNYAFGYGADPNRWLFMRGTKAELYKLAYEGFRTAVVQDPSAPEGYRVVHSTKLVLIDRAGNVRALYDSSEDDLYERIARDIRVLGKENSRT